MRALVNNDNRGADAAARSDADGQKQYLTFMLGAETFAVGIQGIKEIIEYGGLTPVPMMPPCIRGVINLRGAAVPVMDLPTRFGQPASAVTKRTCIVVVEIDGGAPGAQQVIGMVVDAVNAVVDIADAEIAPAPAFGAELRADFIAGMGKVNGKFVVVLDAEHVLNLEEGGPLGGHAGHAGHVEHAGHAEAAVLAAQ